MGDSASGSCRTALRALGFTGEVAAVLLGAGILVGIGEAASHPHLPDWVSPIILMGGAGVLALCLWQAKRLRETYPQLARGWCAGRSGWVTAIFSLLLGSVILGLVALLLGPLAARVGGAVVIALGPLAWLLLAGIVYVVGRAVLNVVRKDRKR
ncbi:MAG: hypothetical protein H7145_15205 [Akkermansiaceae bacterium]|nr:hypothetical protein [Armatimonadota bacterium]